MVVVGGLNDFWFSDVLDIVKGDDLISLAETLPEEERYSYNFEGNAQTLDHMLVSPAPVERVDDFDYVTTIDRAWGVGVILDDDGRNKHQ